MTIFRNTFLLLFIGILLLSCNNSTSTSEQTTSTSNPKALATTPVDLIDFYSDTNTDSISTLLNKAIENNKTPILFFTASWCKPCQEFKNATKYELVTQALKDATIIMIDVNKDQKANGYALDYGARVIPTFIIVDKEGNALNTITGAAWAEDSPEYIAPAMADFLKG